MPFFDRQRDQILFVAGFHAERIGEADATQLAVIGERPAMIWAGEATALAAFLRNQPRAAMAADIQICTHRPIRTTRDDHVAAVELQRDERTRLRYLLRMRRHHRRAFKEDRKSTRLNSSH